MWQSAEANGFVRWGGIHLNDGLDELAPSPLHDAFAQEVGEGCTQILEVHAGDSCSVLGDTGQDVKEKFIARKSKLLG